MENGRIGEMLLFDENKKNMEIHKTFMIYINDFINNNGKNVILSLKTRKINNIFIDCETIREQHIKSLYLLNKQKYNIYHNCKKPTKTILGEEIEQIDESFIMKYKKMKNNDLKEILKENKQKGFSKMKKTQLINKLMSF